MKNKKSKVLLVVVSAVAVLILMGAIVLFFFPIYSISGKLIDSDTNKSMEGIEMSLGMRKVKTSNQGDFTVKNIGKNNPLIANLPKEYEKSETKIDYNLSKKSGLFVKKVSIDAKANPNQEERIKRVRTAVEELMNDTKFGKSDAEYDALHPDCQKTISKEDFIKQRKDDTSGLSMTDFKIGNIKFLDSWKFDKTGVEYKNVAEAETTYTLQLLGMTQPLNKLTHYVNVDGKWRCFWSKD
ncbi:MAG: hypothetical protein NTZ65_05055 [Candidatus Berkelbacteria bacterium]|nr:hypothetical protein [Candidatus Berkelbacteria bacterium]